MKKLVILSLLVALTGCNVSLHTLPKTITPSTLPTASYETRKGVPVIEQVWDCTGYIPSEYAYRETLSIDGYGHWKVVRTSYYGDTQTVLSGDIGSEGIEELIDEAYAEDTYSEMRFVDLPYRYGETNFRTITLNLADEALEIVDPGSAYAPCEIFDNFAEAIARATVELPLED